MLETVKLHFYLEIPFDGNGLLSKKVGLLLMGIARYGNSHVISGNKEMEIHQLKHGSFFWKRVDELCLKPSRTP